MDMRRLERGGGAGQPQENEMEAKLRQWKSGKDQGVPRAAQSMMQIPQSPIYADDDEPMQPPPKGRLPKESASYSYGTYMYSRSGPDGSYPEQAVRVVVAFASRQVLSA